MPSYALLLEYDGAPFVGWQRQAEGLSVQQVLEEAAAHLNGGQVPTLVAAGRTDADGVRLAFDRQVEARIYDTLPHTL